MKVLVATTRTQSSDLDDIAAALPGEVVHLPIFECAQPGECPCDRTFEGVTSGGATTTAEVADRSLSPTDLTEAVEHALATSGWLDLQDPALDPTPQRLAGALILDLVDIAGRLPLGTVLGRDGERLVVRSFASES